MPRKPKLPVEILVAYDGSLGQKILTGDAKSGRLPFEAGQVRLLPVEVAQNLIQTGPYHRADPAAAVAARYGIDKKSLAEMGLTVAGYTPDGEESPQEVIVLDPNTAARLAQAAAKKAAEAAKAAEKETTT